MLNNTSTAQPLIRQEPTKIWNRMFISIFLAKTVFNMGHNMSSALMGLYADSLGAPATVVGMVVSLYALSAMLFRFVSAPIIDVYNKKFIVIFAACTMAVAFCGFSFSQTVPLLVAFRLLQGSGMAFGNACCLTMVADLLPKDKYGAGIGYFSLAQTIATALGPSTGLWLVGWLGFRSTFIINAGIMVLSALMVLQIHYPFKKTRDLKISFNNVIAKESLLPATVSLLMVTGSVATTAFLVLDARAKGITGNVGLFFTVSAITMLASRPLIGMLNDRFGLTMVAIPALFLNIVSFVIISFSSTLTGLLLAAFVSAFGMGGCMPALETLCMKAVTPDRRGAASCTNYIGRDLGTLIGPLIAGAIVEMFGYTAMWRIMGFPFILSMVLLVLCRTQITKIEEDFLEKQAGG
jgi:MFS family permease